MSEIRPAPRCTQFSCFTGTKVQILTQEDQIGRWTQFRMWYVWTGSNVIKVSEHSLFPTHESIVKYKVRNIRTWQVINILNSSSFKMFMTRQVWDAPKFKMFMKVQTEHIEFESNFICNNPLVWLSCPELYTHPHKLTSVCRRVSGHADNEHLKPLHEWCHQSYYYVQVLSELWKKIWNDTFL